MKLGVVFPQTEIGEDPRAISDFAQAVEGMGFHHLLAFDHVLGVDPASRPGWTGHYTHRSAFHEPFVLFAYLAGLTQRLEFGTDVLVLPQRQTPLVAKQAAEVDLLTGGRLRLGIGVGWNAEEFRGMGADFHTRGRRSEEQIALLRALWTQPVIEFEGRFECIVGSGINPLPVQRPIPIWLGGGSDAAVQRVGRMADGWFPPLRTREKLAADLEIVRQQAEAAGRNFAAIGIEGRVWPRSADERLVVEQLTLWKDAPFSHFSVITMDAGYQTVDQHLAAIRRFKTLATEIMGAS